MKRLLLGAIIGAAAAGSITAEAQAQEMMMQRASRFDLGIYAGGAYTSDWYDSRSVSSTGGVLNEDDEGEGFGFGFTGAFGANATFWFTPMIGTRLHYGYIPSELPTGDEEDFEDGLPQNNHLYDLSLIFRLPRLPLFSRLATNLYGWVGGGGFTTDIASSGAVEETDEDDMVFCEPAALARGACLSLEADAATVGQGVVGIGGDLVSLTNNIGIFAELAAHIYDSPVHVGSGFVPAIEVGPGEPFAVADDRFAVTTRFVAGVKLALGSFAPPLPPLPPPLPPVPPAPPAPPAPETRPIQVCVIEGTALTTVPATFDPATGDTTVTRSGQEVPFAQAFPATPPAYAGGAEFFINNQNVRFSNRTYLRFGLPRVITPGELTRVGDFQGVGLFAEAGAATPPEVLYVPVRPGCEFQPYQIQEVAAGVRG